MKSKIILLFAFISITALANDAGEVVVTGIRKDPFKNIEIKCSGKETPPEQRTPSPEMPRGNYTLEESQRVTEIYNSLPSEAKKCVLKIENEYVESVFQYCTKYNLAACISGGCDHTAGYSLHTAVTLKAFGACNIKL